MAKGSISDQLASLLKQNGDQGFQHNHHGKRQQGQGRRLPSPVNWIKDGEDHINISPAGTTDLGRTLHPNCMLSFQHDVFGTFASVSAFWDFLEIEARDDNIRSMGTAERMTYLKRFKKTQVDNLMYFVVDAIWQRVITYERLADAVKHSDLPFDVYFFQGEFNYPVRRPGMTWMIRGFEAIRTALKEGGEPDFSGLMDGKSREELFKNYMETHVRQRVQEKQVKTKPERNELLQELRASSEIAKPFRRRVRPINVPAAKVEEPGQEAQVAEQALGENQEAEVIQIENPVLEAQQPEQALEEARQVEEQAQTEA